MSNLQEPNGWKFIPLVEGLRLHQKRWDSLNHSLNAGHPLLCSDFVLPLARNFAGSNDLLAIQWHAGSPINMAAIQLGRFRCQSFLPSQAPISPTLLRNDSAAKEMLRALPPSVMFLDLMCLDPLYPPVMPAGEDPLVECTPHATTLHVVLSGKFDDYWSERAKSLKQDLQNKWNRLVKDGHEASFASIEDAEAIMPALSRYSDLESKGWKAEQGTALQIGTAQGNFYADVLSQFAARGQVTIYEFRIGGELAATELVLRAGEAAVLLKTTHDPNFSRYAPGYLLDQRVLQAEFESGRSQFVEFYTSANAAKLRWGTAHRDISHFRIHRNHFTRGTVRLLQAAKRLRKVSG